MEHCGHCGGGIDPAKVEHIRKEKYIYHRECYRVKKHWEEQEKQQSEMVRKARQSGL